MGEDAAHAEDGASGCERCVRRAEVDFQPGLAPGSGDAVDGYEEDGQDAAFGVGGQEAQDVGVGGKSVRAEGSFGVRGGGSEGCDALGYDIERSLAG